jgi:hypothetical protein
MLSQTPSKVTQCLEYADDSRRRARAATDPWLRSFWEKMDRKWCAIAQTYSRIEQAESFLAEFYFISRTSAPAAPPAPVQLARISGCAREPHPPA